VDGDFFLNTATNVLYGPKASGAWPGSGTSLVGPTGPSGVSVNYQQIAMQKYATPATGTSFSAGGFPEALAFDGATIWSASYDGSIYGLNAFTGAGVASYNLGMPCIGIVSDGVYNWVLTTTALVKVKVADGTIVWTYTPSIQPPGSIGFDGTNIWVGVPNNGAWYLVPANATTTPTPTVFYGPAIQSMTSIGTSLVAGTTGGVQMFSLSGSAGISLNMPGNHYGIAFDGTNVWVTNNGSNTVSKIQPSTMTVLATYSTGSQPYGIVFDGTTMWVSNQGSGTITGIRVADGASMGPLTAGTRPQGMAFDGVNIWVANAGNSGVGGLMRY
jgi:YVTN family beta-propeller protein